MSTVSKEDILDAIATLRCAVGSARFGLPEDVFLFISSMTPMINVDLLIRDRVDRVLLTWRHDTYYGPGWHVPGGIIRFKERAADRINAVAARELSANVTFEETPLCMHEMFNQIRDVRGHFISMLYACQLATPLDETRHFQPSHPHTGDWAWHQSCPPNLIAPHHVYRRWFPSAQQHDQAVAVKFAETTPLSRSTEELR